MKERIPILLDEAFLNIGIPKYYYWNPDTCSNIIIIGSTGSGKTYFSKLLLGKIALHVPDSHFYICDYKGDYDFEFLDCCKHFYRFDKCSNGLSHFYELLIARQNGSDSSRNMLLLFFDEYASFLNSLDKKACEHNKQMLSNLLMLGRSFNMHIIISQQRADAQYFSTARDNLNLVIALGNLTKESQQMFFSDYKEYMSPDRKRGSGYLLENGTNFQRITVPSISNTTKLHQTIKNAVNNC